MLRRSGGNNRFPAADFKIMFKIFMGTGVSVPMFLIFYFLEENMSEPNIKDYINRELSSPDREIALKFVRF